jgi:hypothetical protein
LFRATALTLALAGLSGCVGPRAAGIHVTLAQYEQLEDLAPELPLPPDSIVARYSGFDSAAFRVRYREPLEAACTLIDSLNQGIPAELRIDTVAIDHAVANLGAAARRRSTLWLSSSYFVIFDDARVLRSVVFHEFGHLRYDALSPAEKTELESIWRSLGRASLLYLVRDGEYSGNARFGGHPNDSPSEMFASAFNLLSNHPLDVKARLQYVDERHLEVIGRMFAIVGPLSPAAH